MEAKGKVNQYLCERCRQATTTVNADAGTTPFMIRCKATPGCPGLAYSQFYRVAPGAFPRWEWYRPTPEDAAEMDEAHQDYLRGGAMLLRPLFPEGIPRRRPTGKKKPRKTWWKR